jgi:hypothetical protein
MEIFDKNKINTMLDMYANKIIIERQNENRDYLIKEYTYNIHCIDLLIKGLRGEKLKVYDFEGKEATENIIIRPNNSFLNLLNEKYIIH